MDAFTFSSAFYNAGLIITQTVIKNPNFIDFFQNLQKITIYILKI